MNAQSDQQLLRDYAGSRSEAAFAELVRRHIDLVYSAALRLVIDAHQAEDVTQGVFALGSAETPTKALTQSHANLKSPHMNWAPTQFSSRSGAS